MSSCFSVVGFTAVPHRAVEGQLAHNKLNNVDLVVLNSGIHRAVEATNVAVEVIRTDIAATLTVLPLYDT